MKAYVGGQQYLYQYYFVGKLVALDDAPEAPAIEYIYDVTADRKTTFGVSVFLPDESLQLWAAAHGRKPTDAEQYGAVKLRLFQAFDEVEDMLADGRRLLVSSASLEKALVALGVQ